MKQILILGGSGFIGYELVHMLLKNCASNDGSHNWNITLMNRGKSFDWDKKAFLQDRVNCIIWDRNRELVECEELQVLLQAVNIFHAVVDFSGYSKRHVKSALKALNNKTQLYVYISSDSVYEVCCKDHIGLTIETDDHRPESPDLVKKLKKEDSYGHKKLRCEECINKCSASSSTKYVILRLADVIGPRDSTERFWQYHLWVKLSTELDIPVIVPRNVQDVKLSLVYARDVAVLIMWLLVQNDEELGKISQSAYNLACKETVKLEELLNLMYQAIIKCKSGSSHLLGNIDSDSTLLTVKYDSSSRVPHIYPSVEKGPVSIQRSKRMLQWNPTSLETAVYETCRFYEEVSQHHGDFVEEKKRVCSELLEDVRDLYPSVTYNSIKSSLRKLLG